MSVSVVLRADYGLTFTQHNDHADASTQLKRRNARLQFLRGARQWRWTQGGSTRTYGVRNPLALRERGTIICPLVSGGVVLWNQPGPGLCRLSEYYIGCSTLDWSSPELPELQSFPPGP